MKVNELAKLTGVNAETIRKYRERGLLCPEQNPKNGYYEYSTADFLNLLYIRKLRGANLSLDAIESTYRSQDAETLLSGYRSTIESLEKQIQELLLRRRMLLVTYRHYERDASAGGIRLIDAFGEKFDCYFHPGDTDEILEYWIKHIELFTLVLGIRREYFETPSLPRRIPVSLGLGTYGDLIKENKLPVAASCARFPEGRYACFFLELEELDTVPAEALSPIRAFLRDQALRPLSDTTAYLYRIDSSGDRMKFIFCTRILVEPLQQP